MILSTGLWPAIAIPASTAAAEAARARFPDWTEFTACRAAWARCRGTTMSCDPGLRQEPGHPPARPADRRTAWLGELSVLSSLWLENWM